MYRPVVTMMVACTLLGSMAAGQDRDASQGRDSTLREVITPPDRGERWRNLVRVGEAAPAFTLPLLEKSSKSSQQDEKQQVSLDALRAERPVVLIFGSITCPPFRGQLEQVNAVYEDFKDQAEFLFIYIREAHPDSVLSVIDEEGNRSSLKIPQAADLESRVDAAATCQRTVKLSLPIAVDDIDNTIGKAYAGWPNRMVVVGTDGRVMFATDPAPRGTDANRLRTWLKEHLK